MTVSNVKVAKNLNLEELLIELKQFYKTIVIDFMIVSEDKKSILIQKRSEDRKNFPGLWEITGGELEDGETLEDCITRHMQKEAKMDLKSILCLAHKFEWESDNTVINLQFIVKGSGEYTKEDSKVTEYRWITKDEVDFVLNENKGSNQIYRGLLFAFGFLESYRYENDLSESLNYKKFFRNLIYNFYEFIDYKQLPPSIKLSNLPVGYNMRFNQYDNILEINIQLLVNTNLYFASIVVLHDLYHNYKQGILSHDDVVTIRDVFGQNEMLLFDIDADIELYRFLKKYYGFNFNKYLETLWDGSTVFKDVVSRMPKVQRYLGSIMSIYLLYLGYKEVVFPNLTKIHNTLFLISLSSSGFQFHKLEVNGSDIDDVIKVLQDVHSVGKSEFITKINEFCRKFANPIIHTFNK